MNERIQELIEQAEKYAEKKSTWQGDNTEWRNEFEGIFKEKFAELIVQECARVVEDAVDHREPASTYVAKIKQHFGVES